MEAIERLETVPVIEVAKALGVDAMKVKSAIKNGTMPIGCVCKEEGSSKERTVILRTRWDKWKAGEL
jgi:hypothetical protein